jgi:hypothetical protein
VRREICEEEKEVAACRRLIAVAGAMGGHADLLLAPDRWGNSLAKGLSCVATVVCMRGKGSVLQVSDFATTFMYFTFCVLA